MVRFKRVLKKLFCPPPLPTVLVAVFGYGSILAVAALHVQNPVLQYASYPASACALIVTVTGLIRIHRETGGVRRYVSSHPLMKRFRSSAVGERYLTDVRFRAEVSLYQGFLINLVYIVIKLVSGILYRSAWFIALAIYYFLLAVMRFLLARRLDIRDPASELRGYRLCGIMLLFMNQTLAGLVIFIVHQNRGFDYPEWFIYAMAAYVFYAVTIAIVNIVKTRRHKSPALSAAKAINLVAAMVSVLSLETAMLARFGGEDDRTFRRIMTSATGGAVCTFVIVMAICMIGWSNKKLREIEAGVSQT